MNYEKILNKLYDFKAPDKFSFISYGLSLINKESFYKDQRIEKYERVVCEFYFINQKQLPTVTRKREVIEARYLVWYLLRENHPNLSLQFLGKIYNRDHATVINGLNNIKIWLETDREFRKKFKEIKERLDI